MLKANFNSGMTRNKLVISNKTKWDTRALRSVFLKVINENIRYEGPLKHTILCTVVNSSRSRQYSGYAYLNSGRMRLRLPPPTDTCWHCNNGTVYVGREAKDGHSILIEDGKLVGPTPCDKCGGSGKSDELLTLNTFKLAHIFEHELAHCRGYQHKGMCALNSWKPRPGDYAYLEDFKVGVQTEKPKPIINHKAVRAARVDARIELWEAKLKRAQNALKKLRRQQTYYRNA